MKDKVFLLVCLILSFQLHLLGTTEKSGMKEKESFYASELLKKAFPVVCAVVSGVFMAVLMSQRHHHRNDTHDRSSGNDDTIIRNSDIEEKARNTASEHIQQSQCAICLNAVFDECNSDLCSVISCCYTESLLCLGCLDSLEAHKGCSESKPLCPYCRQKLKVFPVTHESYRIFLESFYGIKEEIDYSDDVNQITLSDLFPKNKGVLDNLKKINTSVALTPQSRLMTLPPYILSFVITLYYRKSLDSKKIVKLWGDYFREKIGLASTEISNHNHFSSNVLRIIQSKRPAKSSLKKIMQDHEFALWNEKDSRKHSPFFKKNERFEENPFSFLYCLARYKVCDDVFDCTLCQKDKEHKKLVCSLESLDRLTALNNRNLGTLSYKSDVPSLSLITHWYKTIMDNEGVIRQALDAL